MKPSAIIAAVVGAILGAAIWGGITYATGYEIGIVAWGVGGLVGFAAMMAGGEGSTSGAVCAGLALVAIFLGKLLAVALFGVESGALVEAVVSSLGPLDILFAALGIITAFKVGSGQHGAT